MSNLFGMAYRCRNDPDWKHGVRQRRLFTIDRLSGVGTSRKSGWWPTGTSSTLLIDRRCGTKFSRPLPNGDDFSWSTAFARLKVKKSGSGSKAWESSQVSGELEAIEGFTTDFTDRKRAETELQQANERLEQRVGERTAELTKANELLHAEVEQRRQAEEKLAMFRRFAEASRRGLAWPTSRAIIYVNPFLARLVGEQTPHDVIGKHISNYYPRRLPGTPGKGDHPGPASQRNWHGEADVCSPGRKMHPTIHHCFPGVGRERGTAAHAAVITDITELKQAEEALRQSEAKYRALVESCPDAVAMLDLQGRIVFASQRAAEQHGVLHPDELFGRQATDFVVEAERESSGRVPVA